MPKLGGGCPTQSCCAESLPILATPKTSFRKTRHKWKRRVLGNDVKSKTDN